MSAASGAGKRTMRLTTHGRRSGHLRTVTVWFVDSGPRSVLVQHAAGTPAQWYRNLLADPAVQVDFGDGPLPARAVAIEDLARVREVLRLVRHKYWSAWLIQLLGWRSTPVAAEITW
jgi:deazaflavin-dependent oxidoreductase (nitroreductase family)